MHLIYHSIPFEVLMNPKYREFMTQFGENVNHVIDCEQANDEIIAKTKAYALTSRHKLVCPSLIPVSTPNLRMYGEENKAQIDEFLNGLKHLNAKMGLLYNLYPLNSCGPQLS